MGAARAWIPAIILILCVAWAALAWLVPQDFAAAMRPSLLWHRIASVTLATVLCIHAFLATNFEDPRGGVGGLRP